MQETVQLSERQRAVLRRVVEEFVGTGQPVGSKTLVARSDLRVSPSTVRSELAELENLGLLTHPHTSAGRVPTERGYRYYADELLGQLEPQPAAFPLDLSSTSTEVESALQATTEMLSQVTRLLALVSAPPLEATHVRHVEVLLLQPQLVMVVVITSAGGVSKRLFHFDDSVDAGLAQWANDYLNEAVAGLQLGTGLLRARPPGTRRRQPRRPGADGLRESARSSALRGSRAVALRRVDLRRSLSFARGAPRYIPDDGDNGPRLLRAARSRARGGRGRDQAGLPAARARVPSRRVRRAG